MSTVNPSYPQKLAADPTVSAWVSASAGTGKTKVLTDRLLNLMLTGQDPAKILCLTFTKAAAAEMQTRLFRRLSQWVQMTDEQLTSSLEDLWQGQITDALRHKARSLFTQVMDLPGSIKIQTIHGFCQAILGRFPLEAHIPARFTIIDDTKSSDLLRKATAKVLHNKSRDHPDLLNLLAHHYKDQKFESILGDLLSHRHNLRYLSRYSLDSYIRHILKVLDLPPGLDIQSCNTRNILIAQASQDEMYNRPELMSCLENTQNPILRQWLASTVEERVSLYPKYASLFLTQKGDLRKKCPNMAEAERIWRLNETLNRLEIAQKSLVLFFLGSAVYDYYQQQKLATAALDYDDLIEKTVNLLTDPELAAWVLYKLDGGIDHILIDEAQDTNPSQWDVIKALSQDFFRPDKQHRTLFVVGDTKQSIYSFQGANPNDFIQLRNYFAQQSRAIGQTWRNVDLSISFRSTPEVLQLVDRIFATDEFKTKVLAESGIVHTPFRQEHPGKARLWPAIIMPKESKKTTVEPWTLPITRLTETNLEQQCAQRLTQQIYHLLQSQVILPSTGQPVQPRDILILVRKRSAFAGHLIRQLKQAQIPVAGADRFQLTNHLAVKDLLSLGQFLLQPQDDLSLATTLTSPLIGLSHQDLMNLSISRSGTLWEELNRHSTTPAYQAACNWLRNVLDKTDYLSPFELFSYVLNDLGGRKCLISRLSFEADDVITEFLNLLLDLEHQVSPNLELVMGKLLSQPYELKRDSANTLHNEIRLMTIHGSKGLQAPIVILVEKLDSNSTPDSILWRVNDHGDCDLLLPWPSQEQDIPVTIAIKSHKRLKNEAEDKRLLYVALTRAQDHLYMCAFGDRQPDNSWYSILEDNGVEIEPWVTPDILSRQDNTTINLNISGSKTAQLPEFLSTPARIEKQSSPQIEAPVLTTEDAHRGILIHKLLEILPDITPLQRQATGQQILTAVTHDLLLQEDCLSTALKLLNCESFSEFFGPDSIAELEVTTPTGEIIRLDRVVLGDSIKILDFKSSKHPPATSADIPIHIRQQLAKYRTSLALLYPATPIECYVLWTANGRLDKL